MLDAIDALSADDSTPVMVERRPQAAAPEAIFVSGTNDSDLEPIADALDAPIEFDLSSALAANLPNVDECVREAASAAPPPRQSERMTAALDWEPWTGDPTPGLYRHAIYGRWAFRFASSPRDWRTMPMALGRYAELRRLGRSVLYWDRELIGGRLYVPARAGLPTLQARSAVLCTGLMPAYGGGYLLYENIGESLATILAQSVGQSLTMGRPVMAPPGRRSGT
jgi:hypothetical protein